MTRKIVCVPCVDWWKSKVGKYAGEFVKIVEGKARRDFVCDSCGAGIDAGSQCAAVSVSTARTPYSAWESEFVTLS